MKVTISYTEGEKQKVHAITTLIRGILGVVKIRRSEKHKPFLHIYISTKGDPPTP